MLCPKCGGEFPDGAAFCPHCGAPVAKQEEVPAEPVQPAEASLRRGRIVHAGFWLRFAAYLLDSILLGLTAGVLILGPLLEHAGLSPDNPWILLTGSSRQILAVQLLLIMVFWLYWALMESSPWQATFGKKVFGIRVIDLEGQRISFARATGRYFAKILSSIFFIGFVMAGFTHAKQALHDMLAGTLVIRKL